MQYISRSHFSVVLRLAMFFFFALPLCIQAESNVIVANEGEPTATIHDSVNAITGDFFVSQEDMVVQGAEPIRIRRGYISGSKQGLLGGWSFFLSYLKLEFQPFVGRITAMDSSGTVLVFQGRSFNTSKKEKDIEHYTLVMNEGAQSLTNTARGGISGRSNLKNTRAELSEKGTVIKIILPDGGVRTYRKLSGSKNALKVFRFNLESEKLPNGNKIFYTYDGGNQLKRIHTTNPQETKTYAWLNLNFESKKKEKFEYVNIQTSDGKTLKYKLEPRNYKKEDIQLIDTVYSPEYPEELIQYNEPLDGKGPLLVRRLFPEGRAVQAEYYHSKHNNQAGKDVFIPDSSDPRCGRVSILLTPVAYDHNPYPICYFFYHPGEYGKTGGSTEVIDAHSNKIVYHYSPHLRLTTLSRFCNSLSGEYLYNTEKLAWGAENSQDVSNLLCRSLVDPEEKGLFARRFFYDNRGNITEEKLYGNLTGANSNPLLINKDHLPEENGIESSSKLYFYTEDNLLSKEEEENGLAST